MEILGKPTINKFIFYLGKISLIIPFLLLIYQILSFRNFEFSQTNVILAFILISLGFFISFIAIINIGKSLRVGLPRSKIILKVHGVYKYTRNPIYLGIYLTNLGFFIASMNYLILIFTIIGIIIHHKVIVSEELYLENTFGRKYRQYKNKVRRYI